MKKFLKKICILGLVLSLLGGVLFFVGFAASGFDIHALSNVQVIQEEYKESAENEITSITLSLNTSDFTVNFDENATGVSISYPRLQSKKGKDLNHVTITETDGAVAIRETEKFYFSLFSWTSPVLTVTLPSSRIYDLTIEGSTGDVQINEGARFSNLKVEISTGDIKLSNVQATELLLKTSTGDVQVNGANVLETLSITATTGSPSLFNVTANALFVKTSTGRAKINDANVAETLSVKTNSGDIRLQGTIKASAITLVANTGDVKAKDALLNSKGIHVETDTGDVTATLTGNEREYATTVRTDTGRKNISSNTQLVLDGLIAPDRTLQIKTDTGDIKIYFAE